MIAIVTRRLLVLSLSLAALAAGLGAASQPLRAAELQMYEEQGCVWCRRWHAEIGPAYSKTPEGRRAPLVRIDIHQPRPAGVTLSAPVRATPTFVLVENGREVGRITGYPGADFFWGLLEQLMSKLAPEDLPAIRPGGSRAASLGPLPVVQARHARGAMPD